MSITKVWKTKLLTNYLFLKAVEKKKKNYFRNKKGAAGDLTDSKN